MNYLHVWQDAEKLLEYTLLGFYLFSPPAAKEGRQTELLTNNSFVAPITFKKHILLSSPSVKRHLIMEARPLQVWLGVSSRFFSVGEDIVRAWGFPRRMRNAILLSRFSGKTLG